VRERILAEARGNHSRFSRAGSTSRFEGRSASAGVTVSGRSQRETLRRALEPDLFDVVQATQNLYERTPEPELARAHAQGLRVYVKEALANGRLPAASPLAPSRRRRARPARRPMRSPSRRSLRDRGPTSSSAARRASGVREHDRPGLPPNIDQPRDDAGQGGPAAPAPLVVLGKDRQTPAELRRPRHRGGAQVAAQRLGRAPWPRRRSPRWTS
jgi:hypothetical protein